MDASPHAYRLGFAVKIVANGGLKSHDGRRWQSGPHLRTSLELLDRVFDYLDAIDVRVFRLSSSTIPYGTHPDLPQFEFRRQIDECSEALAALGAKARQLGLRLSTHPGQYAVLNAVDPEVARKARLDVEQDALLLDALGQGPEAVVVVHVGGRSLVPLRDPDEEWLRPALAALVEHVRAGGAKRLAVERFDGEPVVDSDVMPLLLEAGFLAGPRRAVLRA